MHMWLIILNKQMKRAQFSLLVGTFFCLPFPPFEWGKMVQLHKYHELALVSLPDGGLRYMYILYTWPKNNIS